MEGRTLLQCGECERTREVVGEIPEEYVRSFAVAVQQDGWAPVPGGDGTLICGECLAKRYAGHETVDDEEKVRGLRDPRE